VAGKQKSATAYVALIADMVSSRSLSAARRSRAQKEFTGLVDGLNRLYRKQLRAKFVITLGDEFQALLSTADVIPKIVWGLEHHFTARELRLGFGYGRIHTAIHEYAINVDGPALHNARSAIEKAKDGGLRGGVFEGFGPDRDATLNGLARVLHHQRVSWSSRQREVVALLHEGRKGIEAAADLGITKQAVSRYAALAGWEAYREGEEGWTAALRTLQ
jgi:hypothetical protein